LERTTKKGHMITIHKHYVCFSVYTVHVDGKGLANFVWFWYFEKKWKDINVEGNV